MSPHLYPNHLFLPTPSHGGRRIWQASPTRQKLFLPTPSHGGRRKGHYIQGQKRRYFYPRPHMEGDARRTLRALETAISTHALTWRATGSRRKQGADQRDFYPRPHMEGDSGWDTGAVTSLISTHALTWRATGWKRLGGVPGMYFYPRPHMEGDRHGF